MDCKHLDNAYELFLLGATSADAAAAIREHVGRSCEYCLEHLREAAQATYILSQPLKSIRPNPKLKQQLLQRLRKR